MKGDWIVMTVREYINICCEIKGGISQKELAKRLHQTPQNLNNKLQNGNFRMDFLEDIADALDADLQIKFIDRKTGKAIY